MAKPAWRAAFHPLRRAFTFRCWQEHLSFSRAPRALEPTRLGSFVYLLRIAAQAGLENTPCSFALTDLWERGGLGQTIVTDAKKGICYSCQLPMQAHAGGFMGTRSYRKRNPRNGRQSGRNRTTSPGEESRRQSCRYRAVKYDEGIAYIELLLSSV